MLQSFVTGAKKMLLCRESNVLSLLALPWLSHSFPSHSSQVISGYGEVCSLRGKSRGGMSMLHLSP